MRHLRGWLLLLAIGCAPEPRDGGRATDAGPVYTNRNFGIFTDRNFGIWLVPGQHGLWDYERRVCR